MPDQLDGVPLPEAELSAAERNQRLGAAIRLLPRDQMEVIRQSFFEDRAHPEIAERLRLPLGTVKSRLRLAMDKLRAALEDLK